MGLAASGDSNDPSPCGAREKFDNRRRSVLNGRAQHGCRAGFLQGDIRYRNEPFWSSSSRPKDAHQVFRRRAGSRLSGRGKLPHTFPRTRSAKEMRQNQTSSKRGNTRTTRCNPIQHTSAKNVCGSADTSGTATTETKHTVRGRRRRGTNPMTPEYRYRLAKANTLSRASSAGAAGAVLPRPNHPDPPETLEREPSCPKNPGNR